MTPDRFHVPLDRIPSNLSRTVSLCLWLMIFAFTGSLQKRAREPPP